MKLVIFGLTISSSWGNGHATLWRGLCRALAGMGHHVVFYEKDVPYYASQRDYWDIPNGRLVLYTDWESVLSSARADLEDADVGMVTSYCEDGIAASELVLSSRVQLKTFYDLDTPVTLDQLDSGKPVPYLLPRGLGDFDLALSYTGGAALQALRERLGARRVAPIYGSVDPEAHKPVKPVEGYRCDLSYLGTYAEDRQAALNTLFIEAARRLPERRFIIAGAQYPHEFPWTDNIYFVRHLPPPEHSAFYCSSRLTLNVTRRAMAAMGYCPSGRLFEASATGTPILSDWWEGLDTFFTPGKEMLIGRTVEDSVAALELTDAELASIAKAARERTLAEHTARNRAEEMLIAFEWALSPLLANQRSQLVEA
ncbi:MAG TPA: glycosyltransferase [Methylomirabilota bacterium]|nr:glycosyltransferase [Methylomirabilota bacterium]